MKPLLNAGADINMKNSQLATPLYLACQHSTQPVVHYLLKHGADIHSSNTKKGNTPLHIAAEKGRVDVLIEFLENGADLTIQNIEGKAPLDLAREKNKLSQLNSAQEYIKGKAESGNRESTPKYKPRFEKMVQELKQHPAIQVTKVLFKKPASEKNITAALRDAKGFVPEGLLDFSREMNGFTLEWSAKAAGKEVWGLIDLQPIQDIFKYQSDIPEGDDDFREVRPFDRFIPESCAAFYPIPSKSPEVYYHCYEKELSSLGISFNHYIDLLLESRGFEYWQLALSVAERHMGNVDVFFEAMPLLFEDFHPDNFRIYQESEYRKWEGAERERPIFYASRTGNIRQLNDLIGIVSVNSKAEAGNTPLMAAVANNQLEAAKLLLDAKAAVNNVNELEYTALMMAIESNNTAMADLLIEYGAKKVPEKTFNTIHLLEAIEEKDIEGAKRLIQNGVDSTHLVKIKNKEFSFVQDLETPLMKAVRFNLPEVVKALIDAGADINIEVKRSGGTRNALDFAFYNTSGDYFEHGDPGDKKRVEIAKLLVQHHINMKDYSDTLSTAAIYEELDFIQVLVDYGVDLNHEGLLKYQTGNPRFIKMLIDGGYDVKRMTQKGKEEDGILAETIYYKRPTESIKLLIDAGANQTTKFDRKTALEWAIEYDNQEIIDLLKG